MSRLVLNSVFSYILVFAITLIVVGLAVGANCSRGVANDFGERARLACWRRRLVVADFSGRLFRRDAETSTGDAFAPQKRNQSFVGSSSSSITRFNKRPAPPPSRLR